MRITKNLLGFAKTDTEEDALVWNVGQCALRDCDINSRISSTPLHSSSPLFFVYSSLNFSLTSKNTHIELKVDIPPHHGSKNRHRLRKTAFPPHL